MQQYYDNYHNKVFDRHKSVHSTVRFVAFQRVMHPTSDGPRLWLYEGYGATPEEAKADLEAIVKANI